VALIKFYSPSCGSCQSFDPIWQEVAGSLKKIKLASVNIDTKLGMEVAQNLKVLDKGIPNLYLVTQESLHLREQGDYHDAMPVADFVLGQSVVVGEEDPLPNAREIRNRLAKLLKSFKRDAHTGMIKRQGNSQLQDLENLMTDAERKIASEKLQAEADVLAENIEKKEL
jgi:thiol-disulfide isomerase/thioredoxin